MTIHKISTIPGLYSWKTGKETGMKGLYSVPVLFALCQVFYEATAQQCNERKGGKSILGMMLQRHIFKRITGATLGDVCLRECYLDVRCQSFNFVISQNMCELNNRTKEARPEDFFADPERYYFARDWKRGKLIAIERNIYDTYLFKLRLTRLFRFPEMLGSIPELPAETCKEIKASEGGQAVSGKYWFDSIIPGETVLSHCDMEKEGKLRAKMRGLKPSIAGKREGYWERRQNTCLNSRKNIALFSAVRLNLQ